MRHTHEYTKLNPHTLRQARVLLAERECISPLELSQRELARRTAARLGRARRESALQVALSRAFRNQNVCLDPTELDALAAVLGLRSGVDLTEPYWWVYREWTGRRCVRWVSGRLPVFSSEVEARARKAWVTYDDATVPRELDAVSPAAVSYTELTAELEAHGGEWKRLDDPGVAAFRALVGFPATLPVRPLVGFPEAA